MKRLETVLLIEDDDTVNFYNEFILKEMGLVDQVSIATNGREGIEFLMECEAKGDPMPQLILLDINMPVMDGFEFLETFEKKGWTGSTLIVMLTTSLHPGDLERARSFKSISDYVYKPLMQERFVEVVENHFKLG